MVALPEYDVLHFCFDNDHGCSLTVLANNERFHVTVIPKQFQDRSKTGKEIQRTYRRLLAKAKAAEQSEEGGEALSSSEDEAEDAQDTGDSDSSEQERDSAVDVSTPEVDEEKRDKGTTTTNSVAALHNWILAPLAQELPSRAPKSKTSLQDWYHTPIQFYKLSTAIGGKLQAKKDSSPAWLLRNRLNELLLPTVSIPKKTLKLSVPQINATDLTVLSCAADPAPFHPVLVSHFGKEYFLKPVDSTQPGPTVREIHLLHSIAKKGLHDRVDFRCPELRGLVFFSSEKSASGGKNQHIAALLLTPIPNPTPLTRLLDSSVPEHQRTQWAKDAGRMVEMLHENGIVWGDAKGDNFLVDGEEKKVWIIDFGGSYTEGWVDEKVKETEEGDWMGTEKVVNALEDPVNGIEDEDVEPAGSREERDEGDEEDEKGEVKKKDTKEQDEEGREKEEMQKPEIEEADSGVDQTATVDAGDEKVNEVNERPTRKRRHSKPAETNDTQNLPAKHQKRSSSDGTQDSTYCLCNGVASGRMLACDGKECKRQWFHFECLGIEEEPEARKWFCEECRG